MPAPTRFEASQGRAFRITLWHYSRLRFVEKMVDIVDEDGLYDELFDY